MQMNPFSETRKDRGGRTQDLVSATVEERRGFLISAPVLRGHRPGLGRWPSGMWSPLLNDLHHCSPTPSHGRPAHGAWDMRGPPPRASAEPPARSRAPRLRTPGRPGPRLLTPQPDSRLCCCAQFSGCSVTPAPPLPTRPRSLRRGASRSWAWVPVVRTAGAGQQGQRAGLAEEWAGRPGLDWEACHLAWPLWGVFPAPGEGSLAQERGAAPGARQRSPAQQASACPARPESRPSVSGCRLAQVLAAHLGSVSCRRLVVQPDGSRGETACHSPTAGQRRPTRPPCHRTVP